MSVRAAVITVSDSTFAGERVDRSGPAVASRLQQLGFVIVAQSVVPDEQSQIRDALMRLADSGEADVVWTTGGTGVAARDVTPEATREAMDREVPGFGEQMRAVGMGHTRKAMLSRAVAGIRKAALIINLPGSPAGAVESLNAIVDVVPHAVRLLKGDTAH